MPAQDDGNAKLERRNFSVLMAVIKSVMYGCAFGKNMLYNIKKYLRILIKVSNFANVILNTIFLP